MKRSNFAVLMAACIALLLVAVAPAFASVDAPYNIYQAQFDAAGNFEQSTTPVTDVNVIGFVCADAGCNHVSGTLWNGSTLNTGNSNQITLTYPTQLQSQYGYAVYTFKDGFIPWIANPTWSGNGAIGSADKFLTKIQDCKAPIDTFAVINDVYLNQPIMVDISTSLDATTRNTFQYNSLLGYLPDVIRQQEQLTIQVTLDIMNSQGVVINTQSQTISLDPQTSQRVQFDYTPTAVDRYTARVSTKVVDNKCLSTDEQFSEKNFNVISQNPTNQCYTLLNNLAVLPANQTANNPVTISFDKISNYYDSNGNLFPLPTRASVIIQKDGQIVSTNTIDAPANANSVAPATEQIQFTPTTSGTYTATVNATVPLCPYNTNIADTASQDFVIIGANLKTNTAPQFTQLPDVRLFYNQGTVNNLFNVNNYVVDPDGDNLTLSITGQTAPNIVSCALDARGNIGCTTQTNQVGCSAVTVQASDGQATSSNTFNACIIAPNRAPVFNQLPNVTMTSATGYAYSANLLQYAFDPDGQVLTFGIVTQTNPGVANCVISGANGTTLTCTGVASASGFSDIRVVASDGSLSATSAFRITVNPGTNTGLSLSAIPSITLAPNSGLNQNVVDLKQYTSNPQNRQLTYSIVAETNTAAVDCALTIANTVNCDVKPNIFGQFSDVTVAVTDGINQPTQTFRVNVGNSAPNTTNTTNTTLNCVTPQGVPLQHGNSATFFLAPSVPFGQSCVSQLRTCNNGTLSGSFTFTSCSVAPPTGNPCLTPANTTIASGTSATFYLAPLVSLGSTCQSEQRVCTNGSLSGSFRYPTCTVSNVTLAGPTCGGQIPQLTMLRNSGVGFFDLDNYFVDQNIPPLPLTFALDWNLNAINLTNQSAFAGCAIADPNQLYCFPNHGQDGSVRLYINVSNSVNTTICPVDVTVGIKKVPSMPKQTEGLRIMQLIVPDITAADANAGSIPITLSLKNEGRHLTDVRVEAIVLELGTQTSVGPFDLGGAQKDILLYLPIDNTIQPGTYTLRVTISDKENGIERIEHRDLVVYP